MPLKHSPHEKQQVKVTNSKEKDQSVKTNSEIMQILEFVGKDLKQIG